MQSRVTTQGRLLADSMTAIGALPFRGGVPPRVDDKNSRGLCQVESHTASLERNQENFNLAVWS